MDIVSSVILIIAAAIMFIVDGPDPFVDTGLALVMLLVGAAGLFQAL
jgi:hypothetical protein